MVNYNFAFRCRMLNRIRFPEKKNFSRPYLGEIRAMLRELVQESNTNPTCRKNTSDPLLVRFGKHYLPDPMQIQIQPAAKEKH